MSWSPCYHQSDEKGGYTLRETFVSVCWVFVLLCFEVPILVVYTDWILSAAVDLQTSHSFGVCWELRTVFRFFFNSHVKIRYHCCTFKQMVFYISSKAYLLYPLILQPPGVYVAHFHCPLFCPWTAWLIPFLALMSRAAVSMGVWALFLGLYSGVVWLDHVVPETAIPTGMRLPERLLWLALVLISPNDKGCWTLSNVYCLLCFFGELPVHVISPFGMVVLLCFLWGGSIFNFCNSLKTVLGILQAGSGVQVYFKHGIYHVTFSGSHSYLR